MTLYKKVQTERRIVPEDWEPPVNPGLNDANNGPCPDCAALLVQIRQPCNRHRGTFPAAGELDLVKVMNPEIAGPGSDPAGAATLVGT